MNKSILFSVLLLAVTSFSYANIQLPNFFSDNMVLQRNGNIPLWGWAAANEKVTVKFHTQTKTVTTNKNGKWQILLDAEIAGGPYDLIITGENVITLKNILVGDVWLCSGQSNMEWTVGQSQNAKAELETATNSMIRHIKIPKQINSIPENNTKASVWEVCSPATVANFTGVGYFFAKNMYDEIKVPIGLINSSWGGTNIETWISREAFEGSDEFKEMIAGMPKLNLDSLSKVREKAIGMKIEALQNVKMGTENTRLFKELSFNDAECPTINQPQLWEQQILGELDGVVWIRKIITLTSTNVNKAAILELSKIDDDDITYVNGVKVGSTNQWDAKRKYEISSGILKAGENVIAVRITDNGGGGGIYGSPDDMKLTIDETVIPLSGLWKFRVESVKKTTNENAYPSLCYNAMINPLLPFSIKGVLWYQGESNAGRAYQYRKAFPLLIKDWRQKFNNSSMPFYFVQLATFYAGGNSNEGCGWAELREAQNMALTMPNTGMCVTTDIGNPTDIHPINKQTVGRRLAAVALNNIYGKQVAFSGPSYASMEIKGNKIVLSFNNIDSGLVTTDKYGYLKGFEIAGTDSVFQFAKAFIENNKVIVYNEKVPHPFAVNFGWMGDASDCNLFNNKGLPAVPFRTHELKTATKNEKYKIDKLK